MLQIKTFLKEVPGKGIGLFAGENLEVGQVWWVWDSSLDIIINNKKFLGLDETNRVFVKKHGVRSQSGDYWLYTDNARFCNHSGHPNSIGLDAQFGVDTKIKAIREIMYGEELTLDYRKFVFDFPDGVLNFETA